MATTIREVIIRARVESAQSEAFRNAVTGPGATRAKSEKAERVEAERHAIKLAGLKERELAKTAALSAKTRRDEEVHVLRIAALRERSAEAETRKRLAALKQEQQAGAFQGEGAKGIAQSAFGDRGLMLSMGVTMGIGFMSVAGPAMKGLAADIRGKGDGPLTGMANEFWGGARELGNELVGEQDVRAVELGWRRLFEPRDTLRNPLDDLHTMQGRQRGRLHNAPVDPDARRNLVAERNMNLLEIERDRMLRLADARKNLIRVEEEQVAKTKQLVDIERQKLMTAKEEFGMLTGRERQLYKGVASKIGQTGSLAGLTDEEIEFARSQKGFASLFTDQARKTADAGGFGDIIKLFGGDRKLLDAEKALRDQQAGITAKQAQFNIANELNINVDPERLASDVSVKIAKMIEDASRMTEQKVRDEIARLEGRIAANAPGF